MEIARHFANRSQSKPDISLDYTRTFPAAIMMGMNEITGPLLITTSPTMRSFDLGKLISGVVSLVAGIDFDNLVKQKNLKGSFPWTEPSGMLRFLTFTIDNEEARGGKEMYIVGVVIDAIK